MRVETRTAGIERSMSTPTPGSAQTGAIEICAGNGKVRIEGAPGEGTLMLVLRMLHVLPKTPA